jgi:insulysin
MVTEANLVWRADVPNKENVNSGLSYYIHIGDQADDILRAKLSLLAHLIYEPCFDTLRTKEQLGYIAQSVMLTRPGIMGLRVHVQSEKSPAFLETRVEDFLSGFRNHLLGLATEDYEKQRNGLITKKLEKLKSLGEEASKLWTSIQSGYYDFLRRASSSFLSFLSLTLTAFRRNRREIGTRLDTKGNSRLL